MIGMTKVVIPQPMAQPRIVKLYPFALTYAGHISVPYSQHGTMLNIVKKNTKVNVKAEPAVPRTLD